IAPPAGAWRGLIVRPERLPGGQSRRHTPCAELRHTECAVYFGDATPARQPFSSLSYRSAAHFVRSLTRMLRNLTGPRKLCSPMRPLLRSRSASAGPFSFRLSLLRSILDRSTSLTGLPLTVTFSRGPTASISIVFQSPGGLIAGGS